MRTWVYYFCICIILSGGVFADSASIHRMVVGDKALELQDAVKLTSVKDGEVDGAWISPDGNYVVYSTVSMEGKLPAAKVCIVSASGGRSSVLLSSPPGLADWDGDTPIDAWLPDVDAGKPIAWSPDGKSIAIVVEHLVVDPAKGKRTESRDECVVVVTPTGQRRAAFTLPEHCWLTGPLLWSADSRKLACTVATNHPNSDEKMAMFGDLLVLDMLRGSVESIFSQPQTRIHLDRWNPDGKSIRHYDNTGSNKPYQQMESFLDRKTNTVGPDLAEIPEKSPDGRMQVADKPGLSVEDLVTGEVKEVFKEYQVNVIGWTPDSKMIVYQEPQMVMDAPGDRKLRLNTLWLAVPEKHKLNHMCVALDAKVGSNNAFSHNGLRMAYVSSGRACLSILGWAELDTADKLTAGIPLDEEEEKNLLLNQAKQIGVAAMMFASDNDDQFPSGDDFASQMGLYARNTNIFNRPGTDQIAFQYFPLGSMAAIDNAANSIMGIFDVGYSWQVVLYSDGHAKVVPKQ